ncbi:MAG: DegV family protein [Erysipelotrichaceae bacterium]
MKKIALMCDSSADITKEEAKDLDINVVRMPIVINGVAYREEEEISDPEIIKAMLRDDKVTTTQPSLGELIVMWKELLKDYDEVFYIPLSKALSGTCRNAINMAKEYNGRVTVVDSEYVASPVITQLLEARKMFEKGLTCEEVKFKLENESELFAILIPEDLKYLKNGGRISPAAAALGGLLKIHPLLTIDHGAIDVYDKVRTLSKAHKEGIKAVLKDVDPEDYYWMIIDANNREVANQLKEELAQATGQEIIQRSFKAVIMSHTGPGTIGFGRIRKIKY